MRRAILFVAALVPCTALAQPADYRITEFTQACERWTWCMPPSRMRKRNAVWVRSVLDARRFLRAERSD